MRRPALLVCTLVFVTPACGEGARTDDPPDDASASDTGSDDRGSNGKADENPASSASGGSTEGSTEGSTHGSADGSTEGSTDDAPPMPDGCDKNVVLMGYWPPTNEMLRPFSDDPIQNPDGWQGENWRGLGYDVYAFFPEFPPDGDPTNDPIGSDGAVGSPDFDLRVDYQATSEDFWRIVDEHDPILLITTSRGGQIGWELEAIEGGHGEMGERDPAEDWLSDDHGDVLLPTQATIDPRSWDAISEFRLGTIVTSALPMDAIADATAPLEIGSVQIDETGTSGNFLSGFLGLHGIAYHRSHAHNLAAGHIHVGFGMPTDTARALMEATVEAVLLEHPAADAACP